MSYNCSKLHVCSSTVSWIWVQRRGQQSTIPLSACTRLGGSKKNIKINISFTFESFIALRQLTLIYMHFWTRRDFRNALKLIGIKGTEYVVPLLLTHLADTGKRTVSIAEKGQVKTNPDILQISLHWNLACYYRYSCSYWKWYSIISHWTYETPTICQLPLSLPLSC